jgi:SAM-dependent methyltransferase
MLDSLEECEPASIDIVFLFFVFEHIGEPRAFLQAIRRVLSPQGKIVLVVPNINDALYARYEIPAFINFYFTPAHHFYYSPKTLDQICTSLGFRADIRTYQRYDLSNHLRWMQGGRPGGQGFYNEVFSDELNYRYREDLVAADHGDTIFAVLTDIKAHSEQDPR